MEHLTLENELRNRVKKRRIIEIILCAVFFILAISFTIAYELSRSVEVKELWFIRHQTVTYNTNLLWGVLIGWVLFSPCIVILICDFVFNKIVTVEVGGNYVTFYRGMLHVNLYVNGEYKTGLFLFGHYLETSLPDGTNVNVSLGKWSAHFSFSNGHPSVDV